MVVKGHSAHPGTGEIVADAILAAIRTTGMPPGTFSLIQGGDRSVGEALVTASAHQGGRVHRLARRRTGTFQPCAARPEPIPVLRRTRLGQSDVHPARTPWRRAARRIARGWTGSLTLGAGQFCTNPGISVVIDGPEAEAFIAAASAALGAVGPQTMLTDGIARAYRAGRDRIAASQGVQEMLTSVCDLRNATPYLYATTGDAWLANHALGEEVFGPLGLVVRVRDAEEMLAIAHSLDGPADGDAPHGRRRHGARASVCCRSLERKAGRLLVNGYPTGVEVADAMVHGGPYPASTNFGATSVGTLSIRRFLQAGLLPEHAGRAAAGGSALKRFRQKWIPALRLKARQNNRLDHFTVRRNSEMI